MPNKACEIEDIQEAQRLGVKYKKKMTSIANKPTGESLRNMGKLPEDRQDS